MRYSATALLLAWMALGAWGCGDDDSKDGGGDDAGGDGDADTDTDTGSGIDCTGDGVWYDDATNLCWQNPPHGEAMKWNSAVDHCDSLVTGGYFDWRLPDIDELITLIRGCVDGTETGDLCPSICEMTPAGCAAADNCEGLLKCAWCSWMDGPGADGCYWDPRLSGECSWYWSSSRIDNIYRWRVGFNIGYVGWNAFINDDRNVRCVRSRP